MKKTLSIFFLLLLPSVILGAGERIKLACVGDSVTYGYGIDERETNSYPAQLSTLLGDGYDVRNFGHNGATLLRKGHRPYNSLPEYGAALDFAPDLVVIHLGLNDSDPRNFPNYSEDFMPDYKALIDTFRAVNPQVKIWICLMTPILHGHPRFLSGTLDWHTAIQKMIPRIAATSGTGLIDFYSPLFVRPDLFSDNLHPDAEGAGILAKTVYEALTGDFGGLGVSPLYSDNMVLQRGRPIIIKGTADRGARISVRFAGHKLSAVSGDDGRWSVEFPTMDAGGPFNLEISAGKEKLCFKNVWTGEVWLCSGQSNMEFALKNCTSAREDLEKAQDQTLLHLFNMRENYSTDNSEWPVEALPEVNRLKYFTPSGWQMSSGQAARNFSAIAYHFGRTLADSLGCHVGLISCAVGGSTTESWTDAEVLRRKFPQVLYDWNHGDFGQPWARERALKNIALAENPRQRHPYQPGYLYDAGIRKLESYSLKGVLWYQGESNAHNIELHERLFPLYAESLRSCFGDDLFIQVVQLSGIGTRPSWPSFRNSQRMLCQADPLCGLTVCSDLGDETDVHPRNKKPVGERSAVSVLYKLYGFNDILPSGPVYKGFVKEGTRLRLFFDFSDGLQVSRGFEVAGADAVYHTARCIVDAGTVLVWSDSVQQPLAIRYGWTPNPCEKRADLKNAALYPASTFKDEKF